MLPVGLAAALLLLVPPGAGLTTQPAGAQTLRRHQRRRMILSMSAPSSFEASRRPYGKEKKDVDPMTLLLEQDDEPLPTVEEAQRGADEYAGANILDPLEIHPNDMNCYEEMTCENFVVHYDEGGHKPWMTTQDVVAVVRPMTLGMEERRDGMHHDHIYWAQESQVFAKEERGKEPHTKRLPRVDGSFLVMDPKLCDLAPAKSMLFLAADTGWEEEYAEIETLTKERLAEERRKLVEYAKTADPYAPLWSSAESSFDIYALRVSNDDYLKIDTWPLDFEPCLMWRWYDTSPSKEVPSDALQKKHTSFLRKTGRVIKHAYILKFEDYGTRGQNYVETALGELIFSIHRSKQDALAWARLDPFTTENYFADDLTSEDTVLRYTAFDHTGTQNAVVPGLNQFADPVKSRLIRNGYVTLTDRVVERFDMDPEDGEYKIFNITTNDPRLVSNVVDVETLDPYKKDLMDLFENAEEDDPDNPIVIGDDDYDPLQPLGGPTLDAAPDLYPTEVTDDFDA